MDRSEAKIWVYLTLYGGTALAVLAAGLFALIEQKYLVGGAFTLVGVVGVLDAGRRTMGHSLIIPNYVLLMALILTWVFFGYDVYDRHHNGTTTAATSAFNGGYQGAKPPKEVWRNEVVPLDGYGYENCEFYNV